MKVNHTSGWGRIVVHILLPAGVTVLLFVGIVFGFMMPKFRQALQQEKKLLIKELVGNVCNLLEHYHQRVLAGELTKEEAQQRVLERIRSMRYGPQNKDYFWVHTLEPRMLMHPYRPDLEGQDIAGLRDSNGKQFILDMNRMVTTSPTHDGYIHYLWQWNDDPQEEMPKLSYVRLFEPWGWVVGTGVYMDDVRAEVVSVGREFQRNMLVAFLIITALCAYLIVLGIRGEVQRQRQQQRLHESFERFKTVMDSLDAQVNVIDLETHELLFMNESSRRAFGEDGVGRLCWKVLQKNQTEPCEFCPNDKLFDDGGRPCGVYRWEFQEPSTKQWYERHDRAIRWVDGRWVRLEISTDITARKHSEQERDGLLKSLALKNEELESIVYIASHDLRSPLINIQGFSGELERAFDQLAGLLTGSELLEKEPSLRPLIEEDIPESLEFVKAGTDKMQMLVNGLLQLSRLGIAQLDIGPLEMEKLVQDVVAACQYQINKLKAEVLFDDIPNCKGDYKLVNQVFTNLVDNALKYAASDRQPQIRITGKIVDGRAEYAIADNGVGIEEKHLSKIFDMFSRFHASISIDGVGLGLTIVKRILDILDGQVRVESEPGKGTTFYLSLPAE